MLLVRKFGFITQAYASNTGSVNKAPSSQGWVDWFLTTISGWFGGVFGSTLSSVEPDLPRSYHDLFVLKDKYKSHVKDLVDRGSIGHL